MAGEAELREPLLEKRKGTALGGRHTGAADQRPREFDRIDGSVLALRAHARSNSLIEVLERVRSSTRFTITQQ